MSEPQMIIRFMRNDDAMDVERWRIHSHDGLTGASRGVVHKLRLCKSEVDKVFGITPAEYRLFTLEFYVDDEPGMGLIDVFYNPDEMDIVVGDRTLASSELQDAIIIDNFGEDMACYVRVVDIL